MAMSVPPFGPATTLRTGPNGRERSGGDQQGRISLEGALVVVVDFLISSLFEISSDAPSARFGIEFVQVDQSRCLPGSPAGSFGCRPLRAVRFDDVCHFASPHDCEIIVEALRR